MSEPETMNELAHKRLMRRLSRMREITPEQKRDWSIGPIGARAEISALLDGESVIYVDGQGNPLEPGWVLDVLRGQDVAPALTDAEIQAHPWIQARRTRPLSTRKKKVGRRATSLGPHDRFLLDEWGDQLRHAFGDVPYLVGSVARAEERWRDVDVRLCSDWADDIDAPTARVRVLNLAITLWGRQVTGLPIDFQFQRRELFATHDGEERNPLMVVASEGNA